MIGDQRAAGRAASASSWAAPLAVPPGEQCRKRCEADDGAGPHCCPTAAPAVRLSGDVTAQRSAARCTHEMHARRRRQPTAAGRVETERGGSKGGSAETREGSWATSRCGLRGARWRWQRPRATRRCPLAGRRAPAPQCYFRSAESGPGASPAGQQGAGGGSEQRAAPARRGGSWRPSQGPRPAPAADRSSTARRLQSPLPTPSSTHLLALGRDLILSHIFQHHVDKHVKPPAKQRWRRRGVSGQWLPPPLPPARAATPPPLASACPRAPYRRA